MNEVGGMPHYPLVRRRRLVRTFAAQVDVRAADTPELQAAGTTDLVKLEVPLVAGVALVSAPDLHGRAGVAHQRRDRGAYTATGDPVGPIGRARGPHSSSRRGPRIVPLRVESLRAERNLAVGAERAARAREMRVGEEVAKPRVRQVLLDAAPHLFPTPLAARAIGALRQPASHRGDAEQAPVLLLAHRELQPNAFVPTEQRQVAVRGGGTDDLEATLLLQAAKGGDEICVDSPEQLPQTGEPRPPVVYERHERPIAGRLQRRGRFVAGGQPLREERLQFAGEGGARKLVRQRSEERRVGKECRSRWSTYD